MQHTIQLQTTASTIILYLSLGIKDGEVLDGRWDLYELDILASRHHWIDWIKYTTFK